MSSVCGIVDFSAQSFSFEPLRLMARSMMLRGREQSGAYIKGGIGLHHNRKMSEDGFSSCRQPTTIIHGGRSYTVMLDGRLHGESALSLSGEDASVTLQILNRYIHTGEDFISELEGSFALALLDESRHKLILARDSRGTKPIYYSKIGKALIFASEIKGILAYMSEGARVSLDAYRKLLVAPSGMISGEDLYTDINELPSGKFAVFCDGNLKLCDHNPIYKPSQSPLDIIPYQSTPTPENLRQTLSEILVAFGYPRFDPYILDILSLLSEKNQNNEELIYESPLLELNESYAYEEADRIGMLLGIIAEPTLPKERVTASSKKMREIEKNLSKIIGEISDISSPTGTIRRLAGETVFNILKKEKNVASRVRILSMLYQSAVWIEKYNLIFE